MDFRLHAPAALAIMFNHTILSLLAKVATYAVMSYALI